MPDGWPEWFAPRRFGLGTGRPIRWQGWAVSLIFVALVALAYYLFGNNDLRALAIIAPAIIAYVLVAALTTRGGWRWRWGGEEE